ncbi:hypothetical protein [Puniceibacterium antarcticum]|uniref:hypothetical protein n=1 Tax=Puniceibacterium antarcticum TaxID=1206336 RepID=UPI00117AB87F|nr:hypothetical protein [Puniceibacterium antarcticum]
MILDVVDRAETSLCKMTTVRIDEGFPSSVFLAGLEARGIHHVARLRANPTLDRLAELHMNRPAAPEGRLHCKARLWRDDGV